MLGLVLLQMNWQPCKNVKLRLGHPVYKCVRVNVFVVGFHANASVSIYATCMNSSQYLEGTAGYQYTPVST